VRLRRLRAATLNDFMTALHGAQEMEAIGKEKKGVQDILYMGYLYPLGALASITLFGIRNCLYFSSTYILGTLDHFWV